MTPNRKPSVSGFIRALLYVGAAFLLALYIEMATTMTTHTAIPVSADELAECKAERDARKCEATMNAWRATWPKAA